MIHVLPALFLLLSPAALATPPDWRDGDIVFQTSKSVQSQAIQLATHSKWSHVGLLFQVRGQWLVLEAVQPVKFTPADAWIARGECAHVVAKRVRDLTAERAAKVLHAGEVFLGRPYDSVFAWGDAQIYCSELVWKAFQRGLGIHLGRLQKLREFDRTSPPVQAKLRKRYPKGLSLDEQVVSPQAIFESLEQVEAWRQ